MRFAVTSQNFRTITGHAGKARRFIIFEVQSPDEIAEVTRLDLPMNMAIHGFDNKLQHPLDETDFLITGGAGDGFVMRMAQRGIRVVRTSETDPIEAIRGCFFGNLKPPAPHDHDHDHGHEHDEEEHACGCTHHHPEAAAPHDEEGHVCGCPQRHEEGNGACGEKGQGHSCGCGHRFNFR